LPDGRVITVSGAVPNDLSDPPLLISVAVIENGLQHRIQLIEIPAVVQGARQLGPREVPSDLLPLSRVA